MILLMLISGSICLIKNHINSVTHSKSAIDETLFIKSKDTRFIYNRKRKKLYADFIFGKKSNYVAILYIGYGLSPILLKKLKSYYIKKEFNIVLICANGFGISGGNKKVDDKLLTEELENWILIIKDTFGHNSKIFLHGFSYTALASLNCAAECSSVFADNTCFSPSYNYRILKSRLSKLICKKKSREVPPGINIPVFLSSASLLSKETYKLYELAGSEKSVYVYDECDYDEYIKRLDKFITHLTLPEE